MTSLNERQNKAQRTTEVAFGIINAEAAAREAKSAKLRKQREALEEAAEPKREKPVTKKRLAAAVRNSRKVGP